MIGSGAVAPFLVVFGVHLMAGCGDGGEVRPTICDEIECDDGNDCTEDICDPNDPRVCVFTDVPEDTPCNDGGVCDGAGQCGACSRDEQCPDDFNECTAPACEANACGMASLADGTPCTGGTCRDGACALSSTTLPCTEQGIRNAIAAGVGPYTFDCEGPTTIVTEAEIAIDNHVILHGRGDLILDGKDDHRLFFVHRQVIATLDGFVLTNGRAAKRIDNQGCGGLLNVGTLTLTNSVVSSNTAPLGGGGGLCNLGLLTLIDSAVVDNTAKSCAGIFTNVWSTLIRSTVSGNTATSGGGGICSSGGLELGSSTVSGNAAARTGGIESSGILMVVNSTISGNASEEGAAGIFNLDTATLMSSTVAGNDAVGAGGDIRNVGELIVLNTLVDGSCTMDAAATSDGYNIESPGDTCGFGQETDRVNVTEGELGLDPLADNGGPTMTHALLPGSVAVDVIPEEACELPEDQRAAPRPDTDGSMCDVGAFELE